MTSNQINYANLLRQRSYDRKALAESKRANLAKERIEREKNEISRMSTRATINYNMSRLEEDHRHNLAQENKDLMYMNRSLDEQSRHNAAIEQIQRDSNAITASRDLRSYNLGVSTLNESMRHNLAYESNQANITDIQRFNTEQSIALANRQQTQSQLLEFSKLQETERANKVKENEINRHNVETERIQSRRQTLDTLTSVSKESNSWFRTLMPSFASR